MTASARPRLGQRVEAAVTGLWLALWQVALAATLLRTAGATVQSFFALTATWLLGGIVGARWAGRARGPGSLPLNAAGAECAGGLPRLLPAALLLGVGARLLGAALTFSPAAAGAALLAGAVAGAYAGAFIASRAASWPAVAQLLLTENNGFVLGYAAAGALLLWRAPWLDAAALLLGVGLWLGARRLRELAPALLLGMAASLYYLLGPYVGDRGWDGLMTATVLAHPDWVTAREVLFFAHPLVIPLTAPLAWLGLEPLQAAAAREALCAGGVVTLGVLAAKALARTFWAGLLSAALLTLAVARWRLATCGEEKEAALLVGTGFLFLYLDHRGLWDLGLPGWRSGAVAVRRAILAALLALSVAVHLLNGALVVVVLGDLLLTRPAGQRGAARREGAWILGGAAGLAGPFFLWLALGPGGARTFRDVLGYFLEYHLSGEFFSLPWGPSAAGAAGLGERALVVYASARAWLVGGAPMPGAVEAGLALAAVGALLWPSVHRGSPAARRLLGWVAINLLHAAVFDSANPESLAPVMTGLVILGSASLLADRGPGGRWASWLRAAVAIAAVVVVAKAHLAEQREARRAAQELRDLVDLAAPSPAPMADLCRLLDAELPRDALLLVSDRLHASYFHIYTRRRPLVTEYLDASPETLRQRFALTSLSLRIYSPQLDSAAITAAIAAGRPVYLLSAEPRPGLPQRDLQWDGLHLYTLSPVIF